MYRLMLYFLFVLWTVALIFSFLGLIDIKPPSVIVSSVLIIGVCWIINEILAKVFKAPVNSESVYITAFILCLILQPASSANDYIFQALVSFLAISSKFILAIDHKHIFNPVAFGVAIGSLILNQQASWWIGILPMWPFILIGGLLIVRKIQRFDLVWSFLLVNYLLFLFYAITRQTNLISITLLHVLDAQLIFFAFIMLTEPQTTPPKRNLRIIYGGLVGLTTFFLTPELALLLGNIFSYLVSPKFKLLLRFQSKKEIAPNAYDFTFQPSQTFNFLPGQYMEWTLAFNKPDLRGNRRYFTLASSPLEKDVHLGIKFYDSGSTFKKALLNMKAGDTIVGSQLSGEFTLPENPQIPLVFMAGGIGITPFRSMIKYMMERGEKRSITLIYSAKTEQDLAYKDLFEQAQKELEIMVIYQTDTQGKVDKQLIKRVVPDLKNSIFYLSGPHGMVSSFEQILKATGIPSDHIKIDFFPGYV